MTQYARQSSDVHADKTCDEHARIVRFCTRIIGDRDAAQDLAQETLLVASCQQHKLRDPNKRPQWLSGIARNLCLMWLRSRARERARVARPMSPDGIHPLECDEWAADDLDIESGLERSELAILVQRALGLLPEAARTVLAARYFQDMSHAEIGAQLGLGENTVAKRLERAHVALRRVLAAELAPEAESYGLGPTGMDAWRETRIWCPTCSNRRLLGRFVAADGLQLDCPDCLDHSRTVAARASMVELLGDTKSSALMAGARGYRSALDRLMGRIGEFYGQGITGLVARCPRCGQEAPLQVSCVTGATSYEVRTLCLRCNRASGISTVSAVALATPAGRSFWRKHERVLVLPPDPVEASGAPAILVSLVSRSGDATLEIALARDTLRVMSAQPGRRRA